MWSRQPPWHSGSVLHHRPTGHKFDPAPGQVSPTHSLYPGGCSALIQPVHNALLSCASECIRVKSLPKLLDGKRCACATSAWLGGCPLIHFACVCVQQFMAVPFSRCARKTPATYLAHSTTVYMLFTECIRVDRSCVAVRCPMTCATSGG